MAAPHFASIYVGDLKPDVTEEVLHGIFSAVGPVGSIRVCRDRSSGKSLGYAYVNFHQVADAERALDTLNYSQIHGRSCRLMWSQRDSKVRSEGVGNVYIKNLDPNIDNKGLFDTFSIFGNIISCKVASYSDGQSKGYGFVQFETDEAAKEAIEKVNGVQVGEQKVEVHPWESKKKQALTQFKNLYIKSFPNDWDEEKLKETFGAYGEITAIAKRSDWKERPFAFVDFAESDAAQKCVSEMHMKDMRSPEQIKTDEESGKAAETDEAGHPLHCLYVGRFMSKAEREAEKFEGDGSKGGKGAGKKGAGKGGYGKSSGKGGKDAMMPGVMQPNMLGVKGKPMVSNPAQMMAMMAMMGKGPPMMAKGMIPPMMGKGPPMMGKGPPMMGKGAPPMGKGMPTPVDALPPLSATVLSAFPPPVQKQMIGEKLFQRVAKYQPDSAAKITGMLLEMDNSELLMLLESESQLKKQIDVALKVLGDKAS